jgi:transcriptional regulator with XRE-family HTH domain
MGGVDGSDVGNRIRLARRAQGLTQLELATLAERSESWVRGVEKGRLALDRHSVIDRLADVLKVDVAWLLGQPYTPQSPDQDAGHRAVPSMRTAIRRTSLILSGHPGLPATTRPIPLTQLRRRADTLIRLRQAADLAAVMAALPDLAEALNTALLSNTGADLDATHALVVETSHIARMVLNQLGHHDLAWSAVENAAIAAARLGDPLVLASSAWDRCGVLLHTGSLGETAAVAQTALGHLEGRISAAAPSPKELSMWGALHLRCAVAASRRHDGTTAWEHLAEAETAAARLGTDRNDFQTVFGPTNVQIHAVEIAVELEQPDTALQRARALRFPRSMSRERVVHHGIDIARAYGQVDQDAHAVRALTSAANLASHYVHNHPMARALVAQLRRRSQPSAIEAGLGTLQRAMNLA